MGLKTFLSHRKEPKTVNSRVICKANKFPSIMKFYKIRANLTST